MILNFEFFKLIIGSDDFDHDDSDRDPDYEPLESDAYDVAVYDPERDNLQGSAEPRAGNIFFPILEVKILFYPFFLNG